MSRRSRRRREAGREVKPPVQRLDELLGQLTGQLEHTMSVGQLTGRALAQATTCLNTISRVTSQLHDLQQDILEQAPPEKEKRTWADCKLELAYIFKSRGSLERLQKYLIEHEGDYWKLDFVLPTFVSMWEDHLKQELGVDLIAAVDRH